MKCLEMWIVQFVSIMILHSMLMIEVNSIGQNIQHLKLEQMMEE
jgi:hypothetical protein